MRVFLSNDKNQSDCDCDYCGDGYDDYNVVDAGRCILGIREAIVVWSYNYILGGGRNITHTEADGHVTLYINGEKIDTGLVLTSEDVADLFLGITYLVLIKNKK